MHFSFQHPVADDVGYEIVEALADADFAVVDADSKPAVKGVLLSGLLTRAVFVGAAAPPGAVVHVPRPIDPTRILRALAEMTAQFPAPPPERLPVLTSVVEPLIVAAHEPPVELPPPAAPAHNSAAKAAARAAARRARAASLRAEPGHAEPSRDVLVLDGDATANGSLCDLLSLFGFEAHPAHDIAQAAAALTVRTYGAFFLDIALGDAGRGLALLQAIRDLPVPEGHPAPAVLLLATELHPSDRVRAALAGIDTPLIKPLSRGVVARALEGCGVTLPADARRH